MKKQLMAVFISSLAIVARGEMVHLEGINSETLTTGDLLDGTRDSGITTNVVEIPGLEITARSGGSDQELNATADNFGINTDGSGDVTDAFEAGEQFLFSFNKTVQINQLDFNRFDEDESITLVVGGEITEIPYQELTNKGSDYLDTNLVVAANTEIEFYTTGSSTIGLDGIDLTVLSGAPELSLVFGGASATVSATFDGAAPTNYVLQHSVDLADSNGWTTISGLFSSNSEWQVAATNSCGYYRAVAP